MTKAEQARLILAAAFPAGIPSNEAALIELHKHNLLPVEVKESLK